MEQGKKRVFFAEFKPNEQLLSTFPGSVFSRRRCQRKLQRDLNLSHLHSSRGLAAFVIFCDLHNHFTTPAY